MYIYNVYIVFIFCPPEGEQGRPHGLQGNRPMDGLAHAHARARLEAAGNRAQAATSHPRVPREGQRTSSPRLGQVSAHPLWPPATTAPHAARAKPSWTSVSPTWHRARTPSSNPRDARGVQGPLGGAHAGTPHASAGGSAGPAQGQDLP